MQYVDPVLPKDGGSARLQRILGVNPEDGGRRLPLWRRAIDHAVAGALLGLLVLHPLSMVAHAAFHPGTFRIWRTLGVSFSPEHIDMTVYFTAIGMVFGLVHGIYINLIARLYEEIRRQSITDELTGLYNRRFLTNRLEQEIARARRYRHSLALLLIDIDHFKTYNDTHGHPAGDDLLRQLSHLLRDLIRESDFAARYGGEEFVVVMPETDNDMAYPLAERIGAVVSAHRFLLGESRTGGNVTVSIGLAGYPEDASTLEELIRRADQALYEAKTGGRNRVCRSGAGQNGRLAPCKVGYARSTEIRHYKSREGPGRGKKR